MHTIELTDEELEVTQRALGMLRHNSDRHSENDLYACDILDKLKPQTYSIGQRFIHPYGKYMLAAVDIKKVKLINIERGRYWGPGFAVDDIESITESEFDVISKGKPEMFVLEG